MSKTFRAADVDQAWLPKLLVVHHSAQAGKVAPQDSLRARHIGEGRGSHARGVFPKGPVAVA